MDIKLDLIFLIKALIVIILYHFLVINMYQTCLLGATSRYFTIYLTRSLYFLIIFPNLNNLHQNLFLEYFGQNIPDSHIYYVYYRDRVI